MTSLKHLTWFLFLFSLQLNAQQRDLNFYLEKAIENSPFIHKNQNDKKLVHLDMDQLKSIYSRPEVTVEAGILFAPIISHDNNKNKFQLVTKDATDYTGYDLAATDGGQYQGIISLQQGLFNGSKLQTYAEKADIQNQISDNNIELTIHELENIVKHQYILCLKSEKQANNSLALEKELDDQVQTMKTLVLSAVYKQSDLMLLEIARQNYLQEYETYMAEYKSNVYDLNLICGIIDNEEVKLQDITFQQNLPLTSKSRFLNSYFLDSLMIAADLKISELKYKPQLSLFANGGMNAVYVPSFNRFGFSTGVTFGITIFDGNQREIEREKSITNLETLEFEKQKSLEKNNIQKNYTLSQLNSINSRITLAIEQLEQYSKLLEIYKIQLGVAEISVMDYKYLIKEISTKKQETLLLEMEKQLVINAWNYWNY